MVYLVSTHTRHSDPRTSARPNQRITRAGFSLIDVLVSVSVIALLIAIMLPSISMVRESARRVICSSDMRQIGLGMNLYAEDNKGTLPSSVFIEEVGNTAYPIFPQLMDTVRTSENDYDPHKEWGQWDGLGLLFFKGYVSAPGVFYCPSHTGSHTPDRYEGTWDLEGTTEIVSNFQFRGVGPNGQRKIYSMNSLDAVVTDSLRSIEDLNHDNGLNVLAAGLSVKWFDDVDSRIVESIMSRTAETEADDTTQAWQIFDGDTTLTP